MRYANLLEAMARHRDATPPKTALQVKAELEDYFGDESNYPNSIEFDDHDESTPEINDLSDEEYDAMGGGQHVMGDHGPAVFCDSWARFVVAALPERAKKMGFWMHGAGGINYEDNDESALADYCDGHAFAVVDDRFIVDGWLKNVEGLSRQAVFDMQDPADAQQIRHFYGNPQTWHEDE